MSLPKQVNIQDISNIFIVGRSGSGKTCLTLNILNKLKYDKLLILTTDTNEDMYQSLKSTTNDIFITNKIDSFPCACKLDKAIETVAVLDNVAYCESGEQFMRDYLRLDLKYYNKLKIICISQSFRGCFIINDNYLHILFRATLWDRLIFYFNHISNKELSEEETEEIEWESLENLIKEEMKDFKEITDNNWKKPFGYVAIHNRNIVSLDID